MHLSTTIAHRQIIRHAREKGDSNRRRPNHGRRDRKEKRSSRTHRAVADPRVYCQPCACRFSGLLVLVVDEFG